MSLNKDFDQQFKVILEGENWVGKTSILQRFCDNTFEDKYTFRVELRYKTVECQEQMIRLQLRESCGRNR